MALERNQKDRKVSLHGRVVGFDYTDKLVGMRGVRHSYETLSTADAGPLERAGVSVLASTTGAATWTLAAPEGVGDEKTIVNGSTHANVVVRSTAEGPCSFYASTGTSPNATTLSFSASARGAIQLVAISTDTWAPLNSGSTVYWSASTST